MRQLPLLWSGVFRVSVILIGLDYLKSYVSLSNNPTLLLQHRYASLLSKGSRNLHQFSRSAQLQLQCSAISQNFVILGGSGDLATTKIIPGLFDLCKQYSALSKPTNPEKSTQSAQAMVSSTAFNYDDFSVKLAARSDWSDEFLKNKLRNILSPKVKESSSANTLHEQLVTEFLCKCSYTCVEAYDTNALSLLLNKRNEHENKNNENRNENKNRNENVNGNDTENEINGEGKKIRNIVYFALPPKQYLPALNAIKDIQNKGIQDVDKYNGMNKTLKTKATELIKMKSDAVNLIEIVLEKPIGYDTETALEITDLALSAVKNREENIWCVDHYIAKDVAVAILPLKTSKIPSISRLFYEYWNDNYISDVNIVFSDTGILDGRSGYFDECGITRDILQNHLIQLLALICADIDVASTLNNSIDYSKEEEKNEISISNYNDIENDKTRKDGNSARINTDNKIIENSNNNDINNDDENIKDSDEEKSDVINNIKSSNDNDINWSNMENNDRSNLISEMRSQVLDSIPPLLPSDLILGQYDSYSSEKGVSINTKTSTFSSCEIQVPGLHWENTTFNLVAGKGLDKKESIIKISYRKNHFSAVRTAVRAIEKEYFIAREDVVDIQDEDVESLTLVLQIQPSPGIYIEEESYPLSSNNDNELKTVKSRRLLLSLGNLPCWPEDSDIIRPIRAKSITDRVEIEQEKEGYNAQNNNANVRSMEAYTRVIESVLLNKSKKELFPSIKEVLLQWKIYGNALKIVENSIHNASDNDNSGGDDFDDGVYKSIKDKEVEKDLENNNEKEKNNEKDERAQILQRREEQDEKEEMNNNNSNNSGSIGLLNRINEIVVKKNIIISYKDKNKVGDEDREVCDVVFEVVQEQVSTLRSYTVGSSIESIMKNN